MAKIGWIGLGNMGTPICKNLMRSGQNVTVWNRTKAKAQSILNEGAVWADSPKEIAEKCDFIFTMVSGGQVLQAVNFGDNGIASGLTSGKIVIDMTTVSPEHSSKVNEIIEMKGCKLLRAPVTGDAKLASKSQLKIFISGDRTAYEKTLHLFKIISISQYYLGTGEESRIMKLIINMLTGVNMQVLAETLVLAEKAGLNRKKALQVISESTAVSALIEYKFNQISKKQYDTVFSISMMENDFDLALTAAKQYSVPLPITAMTRQFLAAVNAKGKGEEDFSSLIQLAEELSGI